MNTNLNNVRKNEFSCLSAFSEAGSRRFLLKCFCISIKDPKKTFIILWSYVCKSFHNYIFCLMKYCYPLQWAKIHRYSFRFLNEKISIILKINKLHQKTQYFVSNICLNTAWNNNYKQFSSGLYTCFSQIHLHFYNVFFGLTKLFKTIQYFFGELLSADFWQKVSEYFKLPWRFSTGSAI